MHSYRRGRALMALVVASTLFVPALTARAQTPADDTKVNKRDRVHGAVTADQQNENTTDRKLAQHIRQALVADKSLSTYAHNVKVIAQDGHVTLKGPVRSADEKATVESKAIEVAGEGHVVSQLSIAPTKGVKK